MDSHQDMWQEVRVGSEDAVHLVILQHGLHGSPQDYSTFQPILQSVLRDHGVYVVSCTSNSKEYLTTHDGIDLGGLRLADEVEQIALQCPMLQKISFIGHSLGGLYIRYCVGVLYSRGFFSKVQPINFITMATPNLGIRRPPNKGTISNLFNVVSSRLFDRTGAQMTLRDTVSDETLSLASPRSLNFDQIPVFPDCSADLELQLPFPNEGYSRLYCTLHAHELNVYFSHLDVQQPPLFSFDLTEFDAVLFVPQEESSENAEHEGGDQSESYYNDVPRHRDIVLQLRTKGLGETAHVDIHVVTSSDWEFTHGCILRSGSVACVSYSGDKGSLRNEMVEIPRNQYLMQCLSQGAFLYGLYVFKRRVVYSNIFFDVQAPYSFSAFRSYNPYRHNAIPCATSAVYPHITLHSFINSTIFRESINLAKTDESEPKKKTWLHGLADIPAQLFPVNKNPTSMPGNPISL
ncbi:hypothetical protein AeRB84_007246 [Aphanomyces euteiches]|nr:hypothetical protein AeRB84_007246 [Aphanomyces euteiches]